MHLVSESPTALKLGPNVVDLYSRMVREAGAFFGACHYPEFHFLVTCSDDLGYHGLEHLACSINGVRERDLIEDARRKGWVANLIPHEYVHSWCGKYPAPGRHVHPRLPDAAQDPPALGLRGADRVSGRGVDGAFRPGGPEGIPGDARGDDRVPRPPGRPAVAAAGRYGGGLLPLARAQRNWHELRRGQDYYFEGALIWLEADAIIRERSEGKKSLDDFCRKFLGANRTDVSVVPYELPEIVKDLHELADFDWESFLDRRVSKPQESLPLDVVGRCGYRLKYATEPPAGSPISRRRGGVSARDSLGLSFSAEGRIEDVVPGHGRRPGGARAWHERDRHQQQEVQPATAARCPGRERRLAQDRIAPVRG